MLKIVCINAHDYLGQGKNYVRILADMVARNLPIGTTYEFICFSTDLSVIGDGITVKPLPLKLDGWWNKLYLFKSDVFTTEDRVLYFDLDTVITGDLSDVISYDGKFAILKDFYRPGGYQSSVMAWQGGLHGHIWNRFAAMGYPNVWGGDQAWIEQSIFNVDFWQDLLPKQFVSYKVSAQETIPDGAKVVVFHGYPRPHECKGWVEGFWKIGGFNTLDGVVGNTEQDELVKNIDYSISLDRRWVKQISAHERHAVIVGGGPSLKQTVDEIKQRQEHGQDVFCLNNSWRFLQEHGISCDYHIMLDARAENVDFVNHHATYQLYASQCAAEVWDAAPKAYLWNHLNAEKIVDVRGNLFVAGGSTVGLNAMVLAYLRGYREIHLYGFDSSYDMDQSHHAYAQPLNDKERVITVTAAGKEFQCAAWMAQQVNEFCQLVQLLLNLGCTITVHGDGLLPHVANFINQPPSDDIVERGGLWWPLHDVECQATIDWALDDTDTILSFVKDKSVCIQAGGNVGVWPKIFSQHFETVYTFEPDPVNFRCLTLNCTETNIQAFQQALGAQTGAVGYERVNGNCGAGQIQLGNDIPMTTIDTLAPASCGLIQLDIEGYEMNALIGATETILRCSPVIVVEDKGLSEKYGVAKGEIAEYLTRFGYSIAKTVNRDIIFIREVLE